MINKRPFEVWDGWEDRAPLETKYPDPKQRVEKEGPDSGMMDIPALLRFAHELRLAGIKVEGKSRAYIIESTPVASIPPALESSVRCAAGMRATLYIDSESFSPIRIDSEVVRPNMCSQTGVTNDQVGFSQQFHWRKIQRESSCGDPTEIWVMDKVVERGTITAEGLIAFRGTVAERPWHLDGFKGGDFKRTTVRSDHQVFDAECKINYGGEVELKPIESVHSEVYFDPQ